LGGESNNVTVENQAWTYQIAVGTADVTNNMIAIRSQNLFFATAGSLRNGLKYYVGAANADDDGGYADKVMAERNRLIGLCQSRASNRLTLNGKDLRS